MITRQKGLARPPSPDAYELARAWQLGEPLAEFQAAPLGFCLLSLPGIGVIMLLVVCAFSLASPVPLALAGLVALALFFGWRATSGRYQDSRRVLRAVLCTHGLVRVKEAQREVLRWNEIDSVWRLMNHDSESGALLLAGYRVQRKDESEMHLRSRDMVGARHLGAAVEDAAVRLFLPDALARYRQGDMVSFGPVAVNLSGVWVDGKMLAWGEINSITVKEEAIQIKRQGSWFDWANRSVEEVPNVAVFAALVGHIRSGQP